jgi:hypothetical protein
MAVMTVGGDARDQARGFVMDLGAGDYVAANERLHETLQVQLGVAGLNSMFAEAAPYETVRFNSISINNSRTELSGYAETASGCESEVSFVLLSERIVTFNITPLCPLR